MRVCQTRNGFCSTIGTNIPRTVCRSKISFATLVSCLNVVPSKVCTMKGLQLATIALWTHQTSAATTFYVSSSTGDDAASGTSLDAPWKSMERVSAANIQPGDTILLANGDSWPTPLSVLTGGAACLHIDGDYENVFLNDTDASVAGWVVDSNLPDHGEGPAAVEVHINGSFVKRAIANVCRPDLVTAGVASNCEHGFHVDLGPETAAALQHGTSIIEVFANSSFPGCGDFRWGVPPYAKGFQCACAGEPCVCPTKGPGAQLTIGGFNLSTAKPSKIRQRPMLRLNGTGVGVTVGGFDAVEVTGIEVVHAAAGVLLEGTTSPGAAVVKDCAFRSVWNRSSVGQQLPGSGRDCTNGWTSSVMAGLFTTLSVTNNLFADVDVALQPSGDLGSVEFASNTMEHANGNTVMMVGNTDWQVHHNVFSRDDAPRFFTCGTTDIMVGGLGTTGSIFENEIGMRGEHTGSPDGCAVVCARLFPPTPHSNSGGAPLLMLMALYGWCLQVRH